MSVHEKRLDFKCEQCPKQLPTLQRLWDHVNQCHKNKVNCDICQKQVNNASALKIHMAMEHGQTMGTFSCEVCPKKIFLTQLMLQKHIENKH